MARSFGGGRNPIRSFHAITRNLTGNQKRKLSRKAECNNSIFRRRREKTLIGKGKGVEKTWGDSDSDQKNRRPQH